MKKMLFTGSGQGAEGGIKCTLSCVYTSASGTYFHLQSVGEKH